MDVDVSNIRKLRHSGSSAVYFMRFGPASTRFIRDGEPLTSVFTNHGRPRQVSIAYPVDLAEGRPVEPIEWNVDPKCPDWAYAERSRLVEIT